MTKKDSGKNMIPKIEIIAETPLVKKLVSKDDLFVFRCPGKKGKCDNIHFRHAGYIELLVPYVEPDKPGRLQRIAFKSTSAPNVGVLLFTSRIIFMMSRIKSI